MNSALKKIKYGLLCLYYFVVGKIIAFFHYDKKYICGCHFKTWHSVGWRWVVKDYKSCKRVGKNTDVPFPVSPLIKISRPENIEFHSDDLQNFQTDGCYYQAFGKIKIGKGSYIAPNVGIITANHSLEDLSKHEPPQDVTLGEKCWVGMNAVILPGVELGDNTVVAAGAVVTKSFPEGNCIIGGVPAKVLRKL